MNGFLVYLVFTLMDFGPYGIYAQPLTDFPMLDGKNDVRLDAALLFGGGRATISYGLTDNIFIQADGYYKDGVSHNLIYYGQLASGWYKNSDHKILEVYGGASWGKSLLPMWEIMGYYTTYFLQGDFGWENLANSHIDVAVGARCGYLESSLTDIDVEVFKKGFLAEVKYSSFYFEPNIIFRCGWEKFKFNIKSGYNFHYAVSDRDVKGVILPHLRLEFSLNYHF